MRVILMLCLVSCLAACGLTKEKLGIAHQSPDETLVESRAPLSLPPEFNVRPHVQDVAE